MVKMGTVSWKSMLVVVMMFLKVTVILATVGGNGANLKMHKSSVAFTQMGFALEILRFLR